MMQAKLLQVLQEGVFYRVGGVEPITVDVRIIAATNRDIEKEITAEHFREDLYYRLNVVQIRMPALRERKEDIPPLAGHFLDLFRTEAGLQALKISESAMKKMMTYDWPGNVRELRNAIERAVVMGNGKEIVAKDLPVSGARKNSSQPAAGLPLKEAVDRFKKDYIRRSLEHAGGNRTRAADVLDIQRTYLSRLISRYGI
jgi:Nif-specific regulatory protein